MKYAIVFLLIGVIFWAWRSQRLNRKNESARQDAAKADHSRALGEATEIVACAICQVHLPRPDAVLGAHGHYCSAAHKKQAGD